MEQVITGKTGKVDYHLNESKFRLEKHPLLAALINGFSPSKIIKPAEVYVLAHILSIKKPNNYLPMASKKVHLFIRRSHRYLGVVLGIQFLLWTVGGLYFSWSNIDEIHGDLQHKPAPLLSNFDNLVSPSDVFTLNAIQADSIQNLQLIAILNKPCYAIKYFTGSQSQTLLADATTGILKPAITKEEAIQIAAESFNGQPLLKAVEYITAVSSDDEYREKPLPAWKVTFHHPTNTNLYVSAQQGKVETFRNTRWRIFDFLWMFHTMDYNGRDNINNWVLRAFSIFGLITIFSGFALYVVSTRRFKKN